MKARFLTVVFSVSTAFLAAPATAAVACEELARLSLPDTKVDGAQIVAAGAFAPPGGAGGGGGGGGQQAFAKLPAFCRVMLSIAPTSTSDIKVEIWLPASGWNGRFQAVGQGGLAGSIPYAAMAPGLATGYATAGSDMGHVGNNANFMPEFPEKLVDFAYRAVHEMALKGKAVVEAHYGNAPTRSYFNGCSGGGRHALTSAQRYPNDFHGIIAGAASWNSMVMDAARVGINRLVNRTATSAIPASKYPMIHAAVLAACDARDGVKDGVLENPTACKFDYASLACKGAPGASCLTPGEVQSAKALTTPLRHPVTGDVLFEGHLWPGSELEWDTLGGPEPLDNALRRIKNITYKDPKWDPVQFDTATDVALADRVDGGLLASNNFDLRPFFGRGGKLIIWHGWSDPQVTPQNSIIYFESVMKTVGQSARSSMELFMLPGVSHCGGGPGPDTFDRMTPLVQWVEKGQKPTRLVASLVENGKVVRTRPLCPFGQVAKWSGKGSTDDEANFSCVAEPFDTRR
jgi:feruloyl esterase